MSVGPNRKVQAIVQGFKAKHRVGVDKDSGRFVNITDIKKGAVKADTQLETVSRAVHDFVTTEEIGSTEINKIAIAVQKRAQALQKKRNAANSGVFAIFRRLLGVVGKLDAQLDKLNNLAKDLLLIQAKREGQEVTKAEYETKIATLKEENATKLKKLEEEKKATAAELKKANENLEALKEQAEAGALPKDGEEVKEGDVSVPDVSLPPSGGDAPPPHPSEGGGPPAPLPGGGGGPPAPFPGGGGGPPAPLPGGGPAAPGSGPARVVEFSQPEIIHDEPEHPAVPKGVTRVHSGKPSLYYKDPENAFYKEKGITIEDEIKSFEAYVTKLEERLAVLKQAKVNIEGIQAERAAEFETLKDQKAKLARYEADLKQLEAGLPKTDPVTGEYTPGKIVTLKHGVNVSFFPDMETGIAHFEKLRTLPANMRKGIPYKDAAIKKDVERTLIPTAIAQKKAQIADLKRKLKGINGPEYVYQKALKEKEELKAEGMLLDENIKSLSMSERSMKIAQQQKKDLLEQKAALDEQMEGYADLSKIQQDKLSQKSERLMRSMERVNKDIANLEIDLNTLAQRRERVKEVYARFVKVNKLLNLRGAALTQAKQEAYKKKEVIIEELKDKIAKLEDQKQKLQIKETITREDEAEIKSLDGKISQLRNNELSPLLGQIRMVEYIRTHEKESLADPNMEEKKNAKALDSLEGKLKERIRQWKLAIKNRQRVVGGEKIDETPEVSATKLEAQKKADEEALAKFFEEHPEMIDTYILYHPSAEMRKEAEKGLRTLRSGKIGESASDKIEG